MWKDVRFRMAQARRYINEHRAALLPTVLAVLAANFIGDMAAAVTALREGPSALAAEDFTLLGAARALGWAAGGAIQTGQNIYPPWALVPAMTNPFILLALANTMEIAIAVVSAVFIRNYLVRATRPLKSKKWLAQAPNIVPVLTGIVLWFRLYGPISDMTALVVGRTPPEYTIFIWQLLSWLLFVPFTFTVYLMLLARLELVRAAGASGRLVRDNIRSLAPIFALGFAVFLVQTAAARLAPLLGPTATVIVDLAATTVRVGFGFWLATVWLLWVDDRLKRAETQAKPARSAA